VTSPVGLRERKRAATRQRIVRAAQLGSLDHGIEGVTIESIARDADISPRSFFNYFPSKEAAIVGLQPVQEHTLTGEEMDNLPSDTATAVASVVLAALGNQVDDPQNDLRREVFRRHPQLLDEFRSLWKASVQNATASVAGLLQRRGLAADRCDAIAFTLVAMSVATVRTILVAEEPLTAGDTSGVDAVADAMRAAADVIGGQPRT
jgi:AcrR family transcriptional regulator